MKTTLISLAASFAIATTFTVAQVAMGAPSGFFGTAILAFGLISLCRVVNKVVAE